MRLLSILILYILLFMSCVSYQKCGIPNLSKEEWNKALHSSIIRGERSKQNFVKGIMQNLAKARYAYNRALRDGFQCNAKNVFIFSILGTGKIDDIKIIAKDYDFPSFDEALLKTIRKWDFGPIENLNDTTVIQYPFVFTH